jgi:hypothetical protein
MIRAAVMVLLVVCVVSQRHKTLRDMVLEQGSFERIVTEDLPPVTLAQVLDRTDLVLKATVVAQRESALSDDGMDILTKYELGNVTVILDRRSSNDDREYAAQAPVLIVQRGGTALVDGQQVTVRYTPLPPLQVGSEAFFLLSQHDDQLRIAMDCLGVFGITGDRVIAPTKGGMRRQYQDRTVTAFTNELIAEAKHQKTIG